MKPSRWCTLALAMALLAVPRPAYAAIMSFYGFVLSRVGTPVAQATVTLNLGKTGVFSKQTFPDGGFIINVPAVWCGDPPGVCPLTVTAPGYHPYATKVTGPAEPYGYAYVPVTLTAVVPPRTGYPPKEKVEAIHRRMAREALIQLRNQQRSLGPPPPMAPQQRLAPPPLAPK